MGGEPLFALNLAGFPDNLDLDILSRIFLGGADKVQEAGAVIAGGHTVTDEEPKYGLSVTGQVHPDRIFTKAGAQPGDILILTKPIGTGVITTAHKRDCVEPAHLRGSRCQHVPSQWRRCAAPPAVHGPRLHRRDRLRPARTCHGDGAPRQRAL